MPGGMGGEYDDVWKAQEMGFPGDHPIFTGQYFNAGLAGGLGGSQPAFSSIAPPQYRPSAAPPPLRPAPSPMGGGAWQAPGGGGSQLAHMQALFGQQGGMGQPMGGAPGGMPPGGPMGGGGLLGQPRQNPMGIVQMGLGPRSNPYTAQQGGFRPTRGLL